MLNIIDELPKGFLETNAENLHTILPQPTLIHLNGRRENPLFVSILLHGNEDVGLQAVQRLLSQYQNEQLPRSLSIFIGNVTAARYGLRRLDGQVDYNRVWPVKNKPGDTPEHAMMAQIVEHMAAREPFAAIDLHNNTGLNPHYACINRLENRFFHLARLFSRTVVYFLKPEGVASMAFADICPAVTCECGRTGDQAGIDHAFQFIDACLNLSEIPVHSLPAQDIDLFHTVATVKLPEQTTFGFGAGHYDICFIEHLDRLNFSEVAIGTLIGQTNPDKDIHLKVLDESGREVEQNFFHIDKGELRFAKTMMPSMLTLNERVIRQDCLCYLMERYPLSQIKDQAE